MTTKIPAELSSTPGIVDGSNATAITIDSSENVGVGTTSPAQKLDVSGHMKMTASNTYLIGGDGEILAGQDSGGYYFATGNSQDVNKTVYIGDNASSINFHAGNAERARILSSGGITFNGDTATANALDDYEEGTWTPVAAGVTTAVSYSGYVKIGRFVYCHAYINFVPPNNGSQFQITGLPYPSSAGYFGGTIGYVQDKNFNDFFGPIAGLNQSYIYFHKNDGQDASVVNSTVYALGGGSRQYIIFTFSYMTA